LNSSLTGIDIPAVAPKLAFALAAAADEDDDELRGFSADP
jgi:hypothetical protein